MADGATKRRYNQAFVKKLYVTPEWDSSEAHTRVLMGKADLTQPYALLLADGFAEGVEAELALLRAMNAEDGPWDRLPIPIVRTSKLQRRGRDSNPRGGLTPPTRFPVALLKPLGHLSGVRTG